MSSILKVDTIQDQSGNNIINESGNVITIGASGDTITVPAGATLSGDLTGITNLTMTGDLTVDTNTLFVDASANAVCIGTTTAQATLHIVRTDVGALNDGNSNGIMIEDTNCGICIGSATTGEGHIYFSDSGDADVGAVSYFHTNNFMQFRVNAAERMRIDSSGNLLVGKTSSSTATAGIELRATDQVTITRSGNTGLIVNRLSSDGELVKFQKDGTNIGYIGNASADFAVSNSTATNGAGISLQNNLFVTPMKGGSKDTSSAVSLGNTSYTWKDIYLGGGAFIGGTGTANKLDDYEEGTWTPSATFANDSASGQNGQYTKIGNVVTATFNIVFSSTSFGVQISVSGLPFTSHNVSGSNSAGFGRQAYYDGTSTNLSLAVLNNSTQVDLYENATALQNNSDKILGKNLRATVVYRTA